MKNKEFKPVSLKSIHKLFFRTQLVLIISLALILGIAGSLINLHYETEKRDQNLQNVAQTIANSPLLTNNSLVKDNESLSEYLDALKETLSDIDVISVVDDNGMRVYHSNPSLIGTQYDGNLPNFRIGLMTSTPWTKTVLPEVRDAPTLQCMTETETTLA